MLINTSFVSTLAHNETFYEFFVRLHGKRNTCLALWKHHVNLLLQSFRRFDCVNSIISIDEHPSLCDVLCLPLKTYLVLFTFKDKTSKSPKL